MSISVFVFGNQDLPDDSLPLRLVPDLQKKFPHIQFEIRDPNEEWDVPADLVVIDTVQGIEQVKIFEDSDSFQPAPRYSMHDFDALANLQYLKKLGKIKKIKIIGIPPKILFEEALQAASGALQKIIT